MEHASLGRSVSSDLRSLSTRIILQQINLETSHHPWHLSVFRSYGGAFLPQLLAQALQAFLVCLPSWGYFPPSQDFLWCPKKPIFFPPHRLEMSLLSGINILIFLSWGPLPPEVLQHVLLMCFCTSHILGCGGRWGLCICAVRWNCSMATLSNVVAISRMAMEHLRSVHCNSEVIYFINLN